MLNPFQPKLCEEKPNHFTQKSWTTIFHYFYNVFHHYKKKKKKINLIVILKVILESMRVRMCVTFFLPKNSFIHLWCRSVQVPYCYQWSVWVYNLKITTFKTCNFYKSN